MANNTRRRGMNPFLAFLLGFLLGLIILVGAVAGVIIFALNYKLDNIEANKDGDGNYIYINADPENGGVKNALELVNKVLSLKDNASSLTLGQVEQLLPITNSLTERIHTALGQFIELDMDEVKEVKFTALGDYLKDKVMEIRPATLMENFGGGATDNKLLDIVLNGKEADYVNDGYIDYPVWYDVYETTGSGYRREGDGNLLNPLQEKYLVEKGGKYRLYFYNNDAARSVVSFITEKDGDGKFIFTSDDEYYYQSYNEQTACLSGNYYYSNGEKIEISPVTLASFADGSALSSLDEVYVSEFIEGGSDITNKVIGNVTLGEIMDGTVDFEKIVNDLEVSALMDISPTDSIMAFLAYSLTDVEEVDGQNYDYIGKYNPADGEVSDCYITVENGFINGVYFLENGEPVEATGISGVSAQVSRLTSTLKLKDVITINEDDKVMVKLGEYTIDTVGNAIDTLTLDDFIEVTVSGEKPDSSEVILSYVVYGISDIKKQEGVAAGIDYTHTAIYHDGGVKQNCFVVAEDGEIVRVFTVTDGVAEDIGGTAVKEVSGRVGGVTKDITIGQLMNVSGNKILEAISHSTVDSLPADIENLTINELYADEIYTSEMHLAEQYKANYLYYEYDSETESYKLVNFNDGFGKLTQEQFDEGTYYTYGQANALWKLMLYSDGSEKAYSVNKISDMITNVTFNIRSTSMYDLNEADIINMSEDNLNHPIVYPANPQKTKVGQLTLEELLNYFIVLISQ